MKRNNLTTAVLAGLAGAAGIVGSAQAVNLNPDGLGQVLIYPYYTTNAGNQTLLSIVNTTGEAKAVKVRFLEGQNSREVLDFNLYLSAYDVWVAAIADATYVEEDAPKAGFDDLDEMTAASETIDYPQSVSPGEGGFGADHGPVLFVPDSSCTVPYLYAEGGRQPFLNFAYADSGEGADRGASGIDRAAEGHFEVIEMGTLVDVAVLVDDDEDPETPDIDIGYYSATAATHDADGEPADCQQLVDAWTIFDTLDPDEDGYWIARGVDGSESIDISHPSGGLFGGAAIVNSDDGTMYSYDARAINGFSSVEIHRKPGDENPSLNDGNNYIGNAFTDDGEGTSWNFIGDGESVDALSYVFMHDAIMNEYNTQDSLNAASEWVVTFPTKSFYTDRSKAEDHADWNEVTDNVDPFISTWSNNLSGDPLVNPASDDLWTTDSEGDRVLVRAVYDGACEPVRLDTIWDREEDYPKPDDPVGGTIPPIVSPAPPEDPPVITPSTPFELCFETQVMRFGEDPGSATEILGSTNFINVDNDSLGFDNGWARIDLANYDFDSNADFVFDTVKTRDPLGNLVGLPATGFWVERFENGFISDGEGGLVAGNYGGIFDHKGTRLEVDLD